MKELCLVIVLIIIIQETCGECHLGWQHFEDKCYFFSRSPLPWHSAVSSCQAHGAELASVQSDAENNYLEYLAISFSRDFWIGGNDEVNEGQWTWVGTNEPFNFTDWAASEPTGGKGENCLVLHKLFQYHWADTDCRSGGNYYICEKPYPLSEGSSIIG